MKTTLEIPDSIFRRAKARAAENRIPLRKFVSDAVAEKLDSNPQTRARARLKLAGGLKHLHRETARVRAAIKREFEQVEHEDRA